jgi:hypothetical protein
MLPDLILGLLIGSTVPKPVSADVITQLLGVEVNLSDDSNADATQGFELRFAARRGPGVTANFDLVSNPILQPENRVVITITVKGKPFVLIDGEITSQQLEFKESGVGAELVISGRDIGLLLEKEEKAKVYQGMRQEAVVRSILQTYARFGISAKVTAPATVWPKQTPQHELSQHGTDRKFLRDLAAANGYLFYIQPGDQPGKSVAYWGPPEYGLTEQPALSVNMGSNTNVKNLHIEHNGLAAVKVTGGFVNGDEDKATEIDIETTKQKPRLAKEPALSAGSRPPRTRWLPYYGPDLVEAMARAQSLTDRSTEQVVRLQGSLDTLVYGGLLRTPGKVGVRGVGATYDGLYYVKKVKHRISRTSYTQEFTLTREGIGANVQSVKA